MRTRSPRIAIRRGRPGRLDAAGDSARFVARGSSGDIGCLTRVRRSASGHAGAPDVDDRGYSDRSRWSGGSDWPPGDEDRKDAPTRRCTDRDIFGPRLHLLTRAILTHLPALPPLPGANVRPSRRPLARRPRRRRLWRRRPRCQPRVRWRAMLPTLSPRYASSMADRRVWAASSDAAYVWRGYAGPPDIDKGKVLIECPCDPKSTSGADA